VNLFYFVAFFDMLWTAGSRQDVQLHIDDFFAAAKELEKGHFPFISDGSFRSSSLVGPHVLRLAVIIFLMKSFSPFHVTRQTLDLVRRIEAILKNSDLHDFDESLFF
jgi:hypothetical protein